MAFEQKENSGVLFRNDRKEKDTHPDYRGEALVDGVKYWVSGWIKQSTKGPLMSLAFKKREVEQKRYPDDRITTGRQNEFADDVPF